MSEHEDVRRDLGVYVLGALEPAERDHIEVHLAQCAVCREELAELAVLPSLLNRLAREPEADATTPPPFEPVAERIRAERRRARVRQRVLAVAAAVAVLVAAVVVVVPLADTDESTGVTYVADRRGVTAIVEAKRWGMAMHLEVDALPERPGYVAVAVADDGHRTQIASWTAIDGPARITGACYLSPDEVDRLEILAAGDDDELLATLEAG
jgi:anti-sigma factor RsiW